MSQGQDSAAHGHMPEYKLIVMGSGGVGKSALVLRFVCNEFVEEYDPTIEDTYRKEQILGKETVMLDILDTAGQEEFRSMRDQWIRDGDGFMLVYDITKHGGFEELRALHQKMKQIKQDAPMPMMLIGNKADLDSSHNPDSSEKNLREVQKDEGIQCAKDFGCSFNETSAKTGNNVNEVFQKIAGMIRDSKKANESQARKKRVFCIVL